MTPRKMMRREEKHDDDNDNDYKTNSQNAHQKFLYQQSLPNMQYRLVMNIDIHSIVFKVHK